MSISKNKFRYGQYYQTSGKKIGEILYVETILSFKLIIAQTITIISSSKSICVSGTIFYSMKIFFTCPITLYTCIFTFDNCLEV